MLLKRVLFGCVLWLPVVFVSSFVAAEDESPTFYYRHILLKVTKEQKDTLRAIKRRYDEEIRVASLRLEELEKRTSAEAEEASPKIRALEAARETEIEASLTSEQRQELNSAIAAAILAKLRRQVDRDIPYLRDIAKIVSEIAVADTLVVYEGLPRLDDQELEGIKRENETVQMDGFDFFVKPLVLSSRDVEQLRSIVANYRSFHAYGGPKFCGGYHPDVCFEWRVKDRRYQVFICFGCHEGRLITPTSSLMVDLDDDAYKDLYRIAKTLFARQHLSEELEPKPD